MKVSALQLEGEVYLEDCGSGYSRMRLAAGGEGRALVTGVGSGVFHLRMLHSTL